jgi:hypothetical protein
VTPNADYGAGRFAAACHVPFSNGTEGFAWMAKWCSYCARDHGAHDGSFHPDKCCSLIAAAMIDDRWPEAWIPEPDDGRFFLPSRMICTAFVACSEGGCTGDREGAEDRAERVSEVTAYWRALPPIDGSRP